MNTTRALLTMLGLLVGGGAFAQEVKDLTGTIERFAEREVIEPYFDSAYGYAVWETIAKGGLGIGAATGRGQVYRGGRVTGFSRLVDISVGFQLGGQAYSQIVFFRDQQAYERFTSGSYEFGAEASAIAVTANAQAATGTQGGQASASAGGQTGSSAVTGYQNGMQVFTMAKGGLMYEASIGGQKYNFTPAD